MEPVDQFVAWGIFIMFVCLVLLVFVYIRQGTRITMYCRACGSQVPTKSKLPGSGVIEFILWLCFLIPGLIYSIWRHTNTYKYCTRCNSRDVIPINSPTAQAAIAQAAAVPQIVGPGAPPPAPTITPTPGRYCIHCGTANPQEATYCHACGNFLHQMPTTS